MKSLLLALMVMLSICSCGAKQTEKQSAKPNAEKSVVIYFSHAGDNYGHEVRTEVGKKNVEKWLNK